MEKVRYHEMLPHEIVARRKRFPAAFIGLGCLEWHGEHLAVGNDALKAEKLCELAAARSGGFAFPTLWYGEPRVYRMLEFDHGAKSPDDVRPGASRVRSKMQFNEEKFTASYFGKTAGQQIEFYQELLYHVMVQMNTLEMRAVCLFGGHYPLSDFAQPAVQRFNDTFMDTQAFAGKDPHWAPQSEDVGGDHAGKWETSYLWYLRPDCVDTSIYLDRDEEELIGVMGIDPRREASIEVGRRACDLIVEGMIRKAEELIRATERVAS